MLPFIKEAVQQLFSKPSTEKYPAVDAPAPEVYRGHAFPAADRDLILHCLMPPLPPGSPHGLFGLSCGSARSL